MEALKARIIETAEEKAAEYQEIARQIHAHPEVSNYEFFACKILSDKLREEGFEVQVDVAGHRTGFSAVRKSAKPGPVIVFLAEYDALQGLGHGCGHNLFGAASCLAAVSLASVLDDVGGEVRVYGTPGEEGGENGSAKGSFVREGFLRDVDAALCVHPGSGRHIRTDRFIGCAPVDIEFWGKAAHASAAPEQGINALDALILTFNGINALRQHVTTDVRIHGIITDGGEAPNTVPAYAKGKFYLRAATSSGMDRLYERVNDIVQGAAAMTGCRGRMQPSQNRAEPMVLTDSFDDLFVSVMNELGEEVDEPEKGPKGSSDVGNISQVVPTIQPTLSIHDEKIPAHTEAFRDAACSEKGMQFIPLSAKAMAISGLCLIQDPELLRRIKADHAVQIAHLE